MRSVWLQQTWAAQFSHYTSHTMTLCPLTCLHAVQSRSSAGDFSGLFDDWPGAERRWRIVRLTYLPPPCWQEAAAIPIDWASSQQPSHLCLTRSGWGGFAYSLDETSIEDEGKTFSNPGRHWRPGQQSSAFDTEPRLLWHISETQSMKRVIIQTNSDTVLKRRITIKQIAAFCAFWLT